MEYKTKEIKDLEKSRDQAYEAYKKSCASMDGITSSLAYKLTDLVNDKKLEGIQKIIACDKTPLCRAQLVFKGTNIPEAVMNHLSSNYKVMGITVKNKQTTVILDE